MKEKTNSKSDIFCKDVKPFTDLCSVFQLDMEDGDAIDVFQQQTGGYSQ